MKIISKPPAGEYAPYTIMYIDLVPDDGLVLKHMQDNLQVVKDVILPLSEAQCSSPWKAGEWTIKEILVHVIDDERVYAYRALRIARNDKTELPGFEQDDYVPYSRANERSLENIFEEYSAVRSATLTLFHSFDDDAFPRAAVANNHLTSVRALAYHIVGHELHHLNSIKENYLGGAPHVSL